MKPRKSRLWLRRKFTCYVVLLAMLCSMAGMSNFAPVYAAGGTESDPTVASAVYAVTVDNSISGGTIAVEPASGAAGDIITVSVAPDSGKQLVAGSLRYTTDGGAAYTAISAAEGVYSFALPAADVVVTAQFENIPAAETYTVTIDSAISGGSLAAEPAGGAAGDMVTVTVTPDSGKQLVAGSLKYTADGENYTGITVSEGVYGFALPAADVVVTAHFENIPAAATYTVTIDSAISGGNLAVDPAGGAPGDSITVTVTPDPGKRLAAGSLKYTADGETYTEIIATEGLYSFVLPAADVTVTAQFEDEQSGPAVWDGTSDVAWYTEAAPGTTIFNISTAEELAGLASLVNNGNPFAGKTIKLTADILLNDHLSSGADESARPWIPISNGGTTADGVDVSFQGVFDGQGHLVQNLYYHDPGATSVPVGLFGGIDNGAVICNVGVTGYIRAYRYIAGIAGLMGSYGSGDAPVIENCVNYATIIGDASGTRGVGGIAGNARGFIRNCYNAGSVTDLYLPAGGIAGILGDGTIENCYNTGTVVSVQGGASYQGAIVATRSNSGSIVKDCYWLDTSCTGAAPYGQGTVTNVEVRTAEQMKASDFPALLNPRGSIFLADTDNINNGYPILYWQSSAVAAIPVGVTVGTPENGSVSYQAASPLAYGAKLILHNEPAPGYVLDYYTVNGERISGDYYYLTGEITVGAVFVALAYNTITVPHGGDVYSITVTKNGTALVDEVLVNVTDYPVNSGDQVYQDDVLTVAVTVDTNVTVDADREYSGAYTVAASGAVATTTNRVFTVSGDSEVVLTVTPVIQNKRWTTLADTAWYTEAAPGTTAFTISSAAQLAGLAQLVSTGESTFEGLTVTLGGDIDLANTDGSSGIRYWTPIGTSTSSFRGTFDGADHTIRNLRTEPGVSYQALFHTIQAATVKNVVIDGAISGNGGIAGIAYQAAASSVVENCVNNADITATSNYVGGIVAYLNASSVTGCVNNGAVTGSYQVGGIAGFINAFNGANFIDSCVNNGAVTAAYQVGGIAGYGPVTVTRCLNSAAVTATSTSLYGSNYSAGGIIGYLGGSVAVELCANSGAVSGSAMSLGGIAGYMTGASSIVRDCYNTGSVTGSSSSDSAAAGGVVGYTDNNNCTVQNTYNAGAVSASNSGAYTAGVIGYARSNTNVSNNYYLDTTATRGLGYAEDNAVSKTSAELQVLAPLLGEYFKPGSLYPVLSWQDTATPATYTVTVDGSIEGGSVTVDPESGAAGDSITVGVTPDSGKQLVADSLKYTADDGGSYTVIGATYGVHSFTLPAANVTVTAQFENVPADPTVWDGSIDVTWYNTTDTVFYIDTPAKLAGLAAIVNGIYNAGATVTGNPEYIVCNVGGGSVAGPTTATWLYGADDFDGKTVYLTADLDMGGVYDSTTQTWSGPNYMPIGGQYCMTALDGTTLIGSSWNGTFDGQGHTVSNIHCSRHDGGSLGYEFSQSVGLIGRMGVHDNDPLDWYATPSIKNVAVTGYIYANRSVGGIVGKNGRSNGSVIENCINYASVSNTDSKGCGGIAGAGWNNLTIKNCANLGSIYTSYKNAGGISGSCEAKVFNSYNVGYVGASSANQAQSLGTNNGGAVWTNCYWLDGSSASNEAVYGSTTGSTITKMPTTDSMKTAEFLAALNGDSRAWVADTQNINSGYPVPRAWADTATLTSITKESDPARLSYVEGETFDPAGLVIWANYSDSTREKITDYTISKSSPLGTTDTSITVSGTCSGEDYSYEFSITVTSNPIQSITITMPPTNLLYAAGESFDPSGMAVSVTYADGKTADLAAGQYTVTPSVFAPGDDKVTISYTSSGVTVTVDQPVTVLTASAPALVDGFYELATADHMMWFANRVNVDRRASIKGKLTENIDLSAVTWTPIGSSASTFYSGTFEGNGKTVTLAMEGSTTLASLFGYIQDATIKDLIVDGSVSGSGVTAGIVVNAMGSSLIQNCVNNAAVTGTGAGELVGGIVAGATDTVTISGCVNNGNISNSSYCVGGIVSYISGSVTVTGCTNTGVVSGSYHVGGIVGNNNGNSIVNNCLNTGAVTATSTDTTATYSVGGVVGYTNYATTIDQCANSGAISGGVMNVGGVAGYLNNASTMLTNSYNTGSVTSTSTSASANTGGVVGRTNNTACTVQNTYNAGTVTVSNSGGFTAGVIGYAAANTNISDNYYLNTTAAKGLGNAADNTAGKTSDELKSANFLTSINGNGRIFVADTNNSNNGYPVLRVQTADTSTLTNISNDSGPSKLSYVAGQTFDPSGLAIWANYSDGTREIISEYTISKTAALEVTDTTINISGTHDGVGFSFDFTITVEANALAGIAVTTPPNVRVYCAGETFDPTGMVITASYANGTTAALTSDAYTYSPSVLSTGDNAITISYTEAGVTKTAAQPVTVLAAAPNMDSDNVYELTTAGEMLWFANQVNVNTGNNNIKGRLLNDIDLSQTAWTPIGISSSVTYGGIFDGNNKTVTLSAANESSNYMGLFGFVKGADIKDLTVAGSIAGKTYVGGIAGSAADTNIENCANNATITGISNRVGGIVGNTSGSTAITGCANNGNVTGDYNVGGIVGYHNSSGAISNCANTGNVTATSASTVLTFSVGGIAGYLYSASTLDQCYNSGAVRGGVLNVGGVAGYLNNAATKLTNSYNTGSVTSETTNSARTGGVVGYTNNAACTVQNTFNAGVITVNNTDAYTAGVIGYAKGNTNVSNNYYLDTTATKGLGYAADNAVSKTSAELQVLAPALGESFKPGSLYPILTWQTGGAETFTVTVDNNISGGSIAVNPASGNEGTTITVTVTPDSGKQLVAGSLKYNDGAGNTEIIVTEGGYSFVLPAANVTVTAQFEELATAPKYTVTPVEDVSVYETGETGGSKTMTVKTGVSGLKYFGVQLTPVTAHEGLEAVIFAHLRDGIQLSLNITKADFDLVDEAQAGFNVQAGDIVKVFIVDDLTNDVNHNPILLQ